MKLVLASFSRARAELLRASGLEFTQEPSGVEERAYIPGEDPGAYVEYLAEQKAAAVAASFPESQIIGADTVLYMDGRTFGKPRDLEDAVQMLMVLSGRTHDLITGVCVITAGGRRRLRGHDTVKVTMRQWSEAHIRRHVEIAKPLAYAGAYALQQEGCVMVERLEGDPNTVIGLPLGMVERMLAEA
jgi:septum formation protein